MQKYNQPNKRPQYHLSYINKQQTPNIQTFLPKKSALSPSKIDYVMKGEAFKGNRNQSSNTYYRLQQRLGKSIEHAGDQYFRKPCERIDQISQESQHQLNLSKYESIRPINEQSQIPNHFQEAQQKNSSTAQFELPDFPCSKSFIPDSSQPISVDHSISQTSSSSPNHFQQRDNNQYYTLNYAQKVEKDEHRSITFPRPSLFGYLQPIGEIHFRADLRLALNQSNQVIPQPQDIKDFELETLMNDKHQLKKIVPTQALFQQQQKVYRNKLNVQNLHNKEQKNIRYILTSETSKKKQPFISQIPKINIKKSTFQKRMDIINEINQIKQLTQQLQNLQLENQLSQRINNFINREQFKKQKSIYRHGNSKISTNYLPKSLQIKPSVTNKIQISHILLSKIKKLQKIMNYGIKPINQSEIKSYISHILNHLKLNSTNLKLTILQFDDYIQAEIDSLGLVFIWQSNKKAYFGQYCDYKYKSLKQKEGFGYQIKRNRYFYVGYFKKNRKEGQGISISQDQSIREGEWRDNRFYRQVNIDKSIKNNILNFEVPSQPQNFSSNHHPNHKTNQNGIKYKIQRNGSRTKPLMVVLQQQQSDATFSSKLKIRSKQQIERIASRKAQRFDYVRSCDKDYRIYRIDNDIQQQIYHK